MSAVEFAIFAFAAGAGGALMFIWGFSWASKNARRELEARRRSDDRAFEVLSEELQVERQRNREILDRYVVPATDDPRDVKPT